MIKNDYFKCFAQILYVKKKDKEKKTIGVKLICLNTSAQILTGLKPSDKLSNNFQFTFDVSRIYRVIECLV